MAANPFTQKQPGGYGSSPFMKPQASAPQQQSPYGQQSQGGWGDLMQQERNMRDQRQSGGYGSPPFIPPQQSRGGWEYGGGFSPDQVRQNAPGRARPAFGPGEQDGYSRHLGGTPDFDERTGASTRREYAPGYGGRIGQPPGTVNLADFWDEDRDGVDDRYQPGPGQKPPGRDRSSPPRQRPPDDTQYAGGSPYFDERSGRQANPYQPPPWMPQAAPSMTFASGDWQGGYASAAPQDRPPPMSVQAFGPWGQTNDPFGQRDALIGRLQQQNMQRQGAFNSFGQQAPQGSPWLDYGMAAQQAGVYSPQWAQQPGPISGLNQQFGGGSVFGAMPYGWGAWM